MSRPHFRAGVVAVVRGTNGTVMAFERRDVPGQWQLPQGGIERDESPRHAAWRELEEETGLTEHDVRLVDEYDGWTVYEWPPKARDGQRLGQVHRWFFFEVRSADVTPRPDGTEFTNWAWMSVHDLIEQVVPFRQPGYQQVLGG